MKKWKEKGQEVDLLGLTVVELTTNYFTALQSVYFSDLFKPSGAFLRGPVSTFEALAHDSLFAFVFDQLPERGFETVRSYLAKQLFRRLNVSYRKHQRETEAKPGAFSLIDTDQMVRLGRRDPRVIKEIGSAKKVEKAFENSLAVVLQSMGFFVVQAGIGERSVDLVCLSEQAHYSFLLEAKSSQNPYNLPTTDERAITDYVKQVKSKLQVLPPLNLVLIVGPPPSDGLRARLKKVEQSVRLPVRYCPATAIAAIRNSMPGPVSHHDFRDLLLAEDMIITDQCVKGLNDRYKQMHRAHTEYVKALLLSKPCLSDDEEEDEHA